MGIASLTIARLLFNAKPFESESLDKLAQLMSVNTTLKKDRNARYFLAKGNQSGCTAILDGTIVFDKKYYQMLTSDEVLAIGAHEFNHLIKKHAKKKTIRFIIPSLVVLLISGILSSIMASTFDLVSNNGYFVFIGLVTVFPFLFTLIGSCYLNARWLREQETECDLKAVEYGYSEAMISALVKIRERYPKSKWDTKLGRYLPHSYPTLEQRIQTIKKATV